MKQPGVGRRCRWIVALLGLLLPLAAYGSGPGDVHWPGFRGRQARGIAEGYALPTRWSVEKGEHIKWKTPIPGLAHSSPIIWGDRVFVTSAVSADPDPYLRVGLYGESPKHEEKVEHDFRVYCLDKKSGRILWEQSAHRGVPKAVRHIKATQANCTPATDGKHVVAFFGSEGLYCFDVDGRLLWKKDFGFLDSGPPNAPDLQWGFASSPVIHHGKVIVLCAVRGDIPVPTPIVAHDLIFITNAHGGQAPVYAVKTSANGDISLDGSETGNEHIAWAHMRIGNYMQTPLVHGDWLYCCRDSGIMACYDAQTGDKHYRNRLASGVGFTASPVAGDGKIYFSSEEGDIFVVQTGPEYKLLARNEMGEICMATPAISEGTLFFRTKSHLIAVGG